MKNVALWHAEHGGIITHTQPDGGPGVHTREKSVY